MEDGTLAFGMQERLTQSNLQKNPHAVYAFNEDGYDGIRIYLEKAWEEKTGPPLEEIRKSVNDAPCPIKATPSPTWSIFELRIRSHWSVPKRTGGRHEKIPSAKGERPV